MEKAKNNKRNKGRKMGVCTCKNCGISFEKPASEINRNEKLNRNNFCSRSCCGKFLKNFGNSTYKYDISQHSGWKKDELTHFRYHYRNIINRYKNVGITIYDLKEQWEQQNGICEFTGIKLILSSYTKIEKNPIYSASLDRIDNSKGYEKNNIRWVSRSINLMKNDMLDSKVWELCELIYLNYKKKVESIENSPHNGGSIRN
jgi:hypothetical protein